MPAMLIVKVTLEKVYLLITDMRHIGTYMRDGLVCNSHVISQINFNVPERTTRHKYFAIRTSRLHLKIWSHRSP